MTEGIKSIEGVSRSVALRRATINDLEFLFRVQRDAMKPITGTLHSEKDRDTEADLAEYTERFDPEKVEVIQFEGRDVGRLRVVRSPESIYVGGVQILPEFQGRGIGTALFGELIEESKRSGLVITLEVHDVNTSASDFYKKLGFIEGEKKGNQTIMNYHPNK